MYELYGPTEIPFTEKKHVVSLCYRLMWNLKNTGKIENFSEIEKIDFATYQSKLYGVITLNDEEGTNFLFDLSKVYGPIPSSLNNKDFEVEPEDHIINVTVNQVSNDIREILASKGKNASLEKVKYTKDKLDRDKNKSKIEKKDLTAQKVEKVLDTEQDEEVKKEIVDKFQDKLLKDLEKKGLINVSDEEE